MLVLILWSVVVFLVIYYKLVNYMKRFGHLGKHFLNCNLGYLYLPALINPDNALWLAMKMYKTYPKSGIIHWYPFCKMIPVEPKLIEFILNTNMNKTTEYSFIHSWLKTGILTSDYEKWRVRKKLLAPAFNMESLQHHVDVFNEKSQVLVDKLSGELSNPSFDITYYVNLCTLDTILTAVLGADLNVQDNPDSDYIKSVRTMCDILYMRTFSYHKFNWIYRHTKLYKEEKMASNLLNDFSRKLIKERRHENSCSSSRSSRTILDILLENEDLTDEDLCEELNTFIFAGHDTTGITLIFALYSLSKNPDVQAKVYNEILEVVGECNPSTFRDLENLKYTSMVLKETSRLYPAVPVVARQIHKDIAWHDCILPAGLEVYMFPYVLHRNEEVFPESEKFEPERFNDKNIRNIPNCAYIPFSKGQRSCIGQKFAILEMKTMLVNILREYEILPAVPSHEVHLVAKVTLQSKNGVTVRLKKRCH